MGIASVAYLIAVVVVAFSMREAGCRVAAHLRDRRNKSLEPIVLDFTAYNLKKRH